MFGGKVNLSMILLGMAVVFEVVATAHLQGDVPLAHETAVRNITQFPACIDDSDCNKISRMKGDDYRCFQYMCYPWKNEEGPFRSCRENEDCLNLPEANGGDGNNGECYRHPNKRNLNKGICLKESENRYCEEDRHCASPLKCIFGAYCGDPVYLEALKMFPCNYNYGCQDLEFGSHCCIDFSGSVDGWQTPLTEWEKRCCEPDAGGIPVIRPPSNITGEQMRNIDITIQYMANFGLDEMICNSFEFWMMNEMEHCSSYITTTPPPPPPPQQQQQQQQQQKKTKLNTNHTKLSLGHQIASIFLGNTNGEENMELLATLLHERLDENGEEITRELHILIDNICVQ